MIKRQQLTLFLKEKEALLIEKIRQQYNPLQYELIKAHVTLCREDELTQIDSVIENLATNAHKCFELQFDKPARFDDGKGLVLAALPNQEVFFALRAGILKGLVTEPRKPMPHITLIHPRNGICTNEIFQQVLQNDLPRKFHFDQISLIEQVNGRPWKILREFQLKCN